MHQAQWSPERPLPPPVSLASQSHLEKPPEVTCTSRGNPGFSASTRESTRETFFNTSRGQIPLPWLGSNDALPLATRMETRLPWRPTRGSLTSPSYLGETAHWGRRSRTTPRFPRHREMRAFVSCMASRPISRPLSKRLRRLDSLESTQRAPRDTRRDSRAERGSLLPLEMNACLPGCVWNATPRSLSPLERNTGFWTQA